MFSWHCLLNSAAEAIVTIRGLLSALQRKAYRSRGRLIGCLARVLVLDIWRRQQHAEDYHR